MRKLKKKYTVKGKIIRKGNFGSIEYIYTGGVDSNLTSYLRKEGEGKILFNDKIYVKVYELIYDEVKFHKYNTILSLKWDDTNKKNIKKFLELELSNNIFYLKKQLKEKFEEYNNDDNNYRIYKDLYDKLFYDDNNKKSYLEYLIYLTKQDSAYIIDSLKIDYLILAKQKLYVEDNLKNLQIGKWSSKYNDLMDSKSSGQLGSQLGIQSGLLDFDIYNKEDIEVFKQNLLNESNSIMENIKSKKYIFLIIK